MNTILILRGIQCSGKSTFIGNNDLRQFAISPDSLRELYGGNEMRDNGELAIPFSYAFDNYLWKEVIPTIIEKRMERGSFIVVDGIHSRLRSMTLYKRLAEKYNYNLVYMQFDISLDEALTRLKERNNVDRKHFVPEEALIKAYEKSERADFSSIKRVEKENVKSLFKGELSNLDNYSAINVIGDVHGEYNPLHKLMLQMKNDEFYIFTGDYVDRGKDSGKALHLMLQLAKKDNVAFLFGNHEKHLFNWVNDNEIKSKVFREKTKKEIEDSCISKDKVKGFVSKLKSYFYFEFNKKKYFITHGGLVKMPDIDNLNKISRKNFIFGVGDYNLDVDRLWNENEKEVIQIHGHKNKACIDTTQYERSINLEGKVEFDGELRIVRISKDGIENISIDNKEEKDFLADISTNPYIKVKELGGNICSLNFTRDAFSKRIWNKETVKARGLFVNKKTREIVARSYDKFFNINEREETERENILNHLEFPVVSYVKENGFLGIIGYDKESDEIFISTKSTNKGDHVSYFKNIIKKKGINLESIMGILKDGWSLTFEVIDVENDPHIVKYDENKLVLLDAIKNSFSFKRKEYSNLITIAKTLGVELKKIERVYFEGEKKQLLEDLYSPDFKNKHEGFVYSGSNNFMVKVKTEDYIQKKKERTEREKLERLKNRENCK